MIKDIYKSQNKIEHFFNQLKQFRKVAARYDKLLFSLLSLVQLAVVLIIIPKFHLIV
ncbi:MAG: transposase [Firmicutes bacterium]|nr:transposase [Bacillota bacterium]